MNILKRITAALLCCMLICCGSALGETQAVTSQQTAVYVAKNGKAVKTGTIPEGTELTVLNVRGSWALVEKDGYQAYVKKSALSVDMTANVTETVTACEQVVYTSADNVPVYSENSETSEVLGTLPAGTALKMTAYTDTWCRVQNGKTSAYVKRYQVSLTKTSSSDTSSSANVTSCDTKVYVNNDGAAVYRSAGTSSKVLGTLSKGVELTMTAYTDTWCRVTANGNTGYMLKSDLSLTKPETDSGTCNITMYAASDNVPVYKSASTSSKVMTKLSKDLAVNVVAYSGDWYMVKNGSYTGYMTKSSLSTTSSAADTTPTSLKYGDEGVYVQKLQQRLKDLGYFSGSTAGNYLDQTKTAVEKFQSQNGLTVSGNADTATLTLLFSDSAAKYDSSKDSSSATAETTQANGKSTATPASGHSVEMDWWTSDIQTIFARGTVAVITDVTTGISWKEIRSGGYNHADCQPLTAADTAAFKAAAGSWSWKRRPIWVSINGKKYAASMNCMPHGSGSIKDNNFNGHHCIHFTNSRTHGTNRVCPLHQAAIKEAYSKG